MSGQTDVAFLRAAVVSGVMHHSVLTPEESSPVLLHAAPPTFSFVNADFAAAAASSFFKSTQHQKKQVSSKARSTPQKVICSVLSAALNLSNVSSAAKRPSPTSFTAG